MMKRIYSYFVIIILTGIISCELTPKEPVNPLDPKNATKEPLSIVCLTERAPQIISRTVFWENDFIHKNVKQIKIDEYTVDVIAKKLILPTDSRAPKEYVTIPETYQWPIPNVELVYDDKYSNHYLRINLLSQGFYMKDIFLAKDSTGLDMKSLNEHISSGVDYSNKYKGDYNIQVAPLNYFKNYNYIKIIWDSKGETGFNYFSLLEDK